MINSGNLLYDPKYLVRCLLGLLGVILVMRFTGGAGFAVSFVLLFTCLSRKNTELLFYTLILTIAITMGNGNIVRKGSLFGVEQRVLMLTMAGVMVVRIAGSVKSKYLTSFLGLFAYVAYMIVPSANGFNPFISFLKLFLFTMVYAAYFGVANSVVTSSRQNAAKVRSIFLMLAVFFIFGSVALIPFPGLSQMSWEQMRRAAEAGQTVTSLFTGMTFHSQSLGPLCSSLGVMLLADLVFSIKRPDKLYGALLLCVPVLIWKTSSRTAMGSFVAGVMFIMFLLTHARNVKSTWKGKITSYITTVVVFVCILVLALPSARESAMKFMLKFNTEDKREVTFSEVTSTRKGKWDAAMYNFKQKPMIGNGFQVSEDLIDFEASFSTMSAPVEKGVWVAAILEEGGVMGMCLFLFFAVSVFRSLWKYKCYQGLVGFFMILLINMGEFTIFSLTSTGGLLWAVVFIGVILDAQRMKSEQCLRTMFYYAR